MPKVKMLSRIMNQPKKILLRGAEAMFSFFTPSAAISPIDETIGLCVRSYLWFASRTEALYMSASNVMHAPRTAGRPLWLLAGFWLCVVIAIAVVVRRLVALAHPTAGGRPRWPGWTPRSRHTRC